MHRTRRSLAVLLLLIAGSGIAFAQFFYGGGRIRVAEGTMTAREIPTRSVGTPEWTNPVGFEKDVFTFARLRYGVDGWRGGAGGGSWSTDLPDADLNLSYRLQQMTAIRTDPNCRLLRANDPELYKFPFLMTAAGGAMDLNDDEILGLRKYLLNGGFFLITDFWGDAEWDHFAYVMQQVLPGKSFVELSLDHPIYRTVFQIHAKNRVPRIDVARRAADYGTPTYETNHYGETQTVHHRAILDDKGRIMVLALHNSDDSDGWEREGEETDYFHQYSEKMAYPLAINIIVYVMTH